ncbi:MAG: alpha/beta hydrolase [Anaerolineae bacterium]
MTQTSTAPRKDHSAWRIVKRVLGIVGIVLLAVLAIILLLGLVPLSSQGLQTEPDPAPTYEEALARFEQVELAEQAIVNDLGHSRLLVHGERTATAYVLVHGTTNSPEQWQELGDTLYNEGYNVLILRMPYHGLESHQVSELKQLSPQDLRTYADQAVDVAAGLGDEIVVVGISGGGAVSAWMAQNRPEVDRALLLAPFFGVHGVPDFAGTLLMNAFSRLPNVVLDDPLEPRRDWVYRGEATRGVAAFLALGHDVVQGAKEGAAPESQVIVVTTAKDNTANNRSTTKLVDLWQQAGTDVVTFEFEPSLDIPHNSVDPAADAAKKQRVYEQMLSLLGEEEARVP